MKNSIIFHLLKVVPLPISGLMLALLSCGIFLFNAEIYNGAAVFFLFAMIVFTLLSLKWLLVPKDCFKQLQNPVILSVFPTFTMSIMLCASFVAQHTDLYMLCAIAWWVAIIIHTYASLVFIYKYCIKNRPSMRMIFPSWFIPFVGFGMISVTANIFHVWWIGMFMLVISVIGYVALLPFILKKILVYKDLEIQKQPLIIILSTPGSLCLAGYIALMNVSGGMSITICYLICQVFYVIAVAHLPKLLKLPFFPSYSAFTFPLVISATVSYSMYGLLQSELLYYIANIELMLAFMLVMYVSLRYGFYLFTQVKDIDERKLV